MAIAIISTGGKDWTVFTNHSGLNEIVTETMVSHARRRRCRRH